MDNRLLGTESNVIGTKQQFQILCIRLQFYLVFLLAAILPRHTMFIINNPTTPYHLPSTTYQPSAIPPLMVRYSYGKNPDRNPPSSSMDEEHGHFRWSGFRPSALFSHARFARFGGVFYLLHGFRAHLHHQRHHRPQS